MYGITAQTVYLVIAFHLVHPFESQYVRIVGFLVSRKEKNQKKEGLYNLRVPAVDPF
jgi:hypothetical protein